MATTSQRIGRSWQTGDDPGRAAPAAVRVPWRSVPPRARRPAPAGPPTPAVTPAQPTAVTTPTTPSDESNPDFAQRVLDVVDAIPVQRVMAYGDIAEYLGEGGPRRVAKVMSSRGSEVSWWRVLRADGTPAPQVAARQLRLLRDEGTPMRPSGDRVDIAHARWLGDGDREGSTVGTSDGDGRSGH